MGNVSLVLAQAASAGNLTPLYYGLSILALIIGGLWALKRYGDQQKTQLVEQAARDQSLADKLDANTKAADKNSASLERLGDKFDTFSSAVDKRLTLMDYRVEKLEEDARKCKDDSRKMT